ncbi:beta-1,4-galactosyltransferase 7-like [Mizuhopecten yessoensis]|uniref:beta-1,4-galactosyltransferase 7-like n=1 Tax=Mizuhopecten yessoensis TaxID=6573 RepID=UPI000B45A853|nr:beta-1,4-galactosyltransferase 7-like [Mizuhopecten yessoensis]
MSQNKLEVYSELHANTQTARKHFDPGDELKKLRNIKTYNKTHKMALLVPFRNCTNELKEFAPHMMKFLNNQRIPHTIYVINQVDDLRFNRATLVNIGFIESHPDCDYIAIHDVDLLPLNPKLNYSFPSEGPFHVSSPDLHPLYHYSEFTGGILLMTRKHYEKVNGMSNKFWGWGSEDDELALRILHFGFKIRRPLGLKTGVWNTFRHIHETVRRPRDKIRFFHQNKALPLNIDGVVMFV